MSDSVREAVKVNKNELEGSGRSLIWGNHSIRLEEIACLKDKFRSQDLPNAESEWQQLDH
jgi:hypothetical protein